MDKSDKDRMCILLAFFGFLGFYIFGMFVGLEIQRKEDVKAGVACYAADGKGGVKFEYINKEEK